MIAAIYARKSTEQNGVSDEEKSVTRQIDHAKAYALKKGWTVPDELAFIDDGVSGAEFVKRPGFIRLMSALKPKPAFQFLIMSEGPRLGREQIETAYVLKKILDTGVRVFFYLEDKERTLDTPLEKLLLQLSNYADETERERARQRTYDAMLRKAKAGHVTGGKVYGYENKDVLSNDGHRLHVVRVVKENEAARVRQIFEMYAGGLGIGRIAKRLNADGVPAPRQSKRGWAPSAVREMLRRPIYRGQIVWNESQKIVRGGTKKRRIRPESERVIFDDPGLRIIPSDLWESVQARLAYRKSKTRPWVRDIESPYLLTGFCRCSVCNGPITMSGPGSPKSHRRRGKFYGCAYHIKRGPKVCRNSVLAPQELLERAVLDRLSDLLHPHVLDLALQEAMDRLQPDQARLRTERARIEKQLGQAKTAQQRLTDAIAQGGNLEALLEALTREELKQKELSVELARLHEAGPSEWAIACLRREAKTRLANTQALLSRQSHEARAILRRLFDAPLSFGSVEEDGRVKFVVEGTGNFSTLLTVSDLSPTPPSNVVSPTGSVRPRSSH